MRIIGLIGYLEYCNIPILEKNEFNIVIAGKFNEETFKKLKEYKEIEEIEEDNYNILVCSSASLDTIRNIFNLLDSKKESYYIVNWILHIGSTLKKNLISFDDMMRNLKQAYNISLLSNNDRTTVIEYTYENIEKNELRKPLAIYMNECIKKGDKNIIIQINNIKPHVMLYLSNIIRTLNENNNVAHNDFIAILKERSLFYDVWEYLKKNDIKYIFEWKINIEKIPKDILKQIEDFLQSFKVKYNIEKRFDNIILNMYPENEEVIGFITDVLDLNNIWYTEEYDPDNIDSSGTSLWMFSTSKEKEISEMLKKPDQGRIDRLKELGTPEFIIKDEESGPTKCTYGVITFEKLQKQIENILKSLKLNYKVLNSKGEIIKKYNDPKAINEEL